MAQTTLEQLCLKLKEHVRYQGVLGEKFLLSRPAELQLSLVQP